MKDLQLVWDWAEIYVWFLGIWFVIGGLFTYFLLPRIVDLPCSNKCITQSNPDWTAWMFITGGTADDPLNIR